MDIGVNRFQVEGTASAEALRWERAWMFKKQKEGPVRPGWGHTAIKLYKSCEEVSAGLFFTCGEIYTMKLCINIPT